MNDGNPFFDTNLLIYALVTGDRRAEVARGILAQGGVISVQVLNEFVAVARRKLRMSWQEIGEALTGIQALCPRPLPISLDTHNTALGIAERYGYSLYDALVIASALEGSCKTLFSEDMRDGHTIQGLTIRNPFKERN